MKVTTDSLSGGTAALACDDYSFDYVIHSMQLKYDSLTDGADSLSGENHSLD